MASPPTARSLLAALQAERPRFHAASAAEQGDAGRWDWSIRPQVLEFLADLDTPLEATLETGCGYTTVLLAARSRRHHAVTPVGGEIRLIRDWAEAHGLPMGHVMHLDGPSQDVLPRIQLPPLDLILVDGDHAFPAPFIDWYYTADRLRPGGLLLIDDIHLRACRMLDSFLRTETARWQACTRLGNTSVWRRRDNRPVARGVTHGEQPFAQEIRSVSWAMGRVRNAARAALKGA